MHAIIFLTFSKLRYKNFQITQLIPCQVCIFMMRGCDNINFQKLRKIGINLAVSNYRDLRYGNEANALNSMLA